MYTTTVNAAFIALLIYFCFVISVYLGTGEFTDTGGMLTVVIFAIGVAIVSSLVLMFIGRPFPYGGHFIGSLAKSYGIVALFWALPALGGLVGKLGAATHLQRFSGKYLVIVVPLIVLVLALSYDPVESLQNFIAGPPVGGEDRPTYWSYVGLEGGYEGQAFETLQGVIVAFVFGVPLSWLSLKYARWLHGLPAA